MSAPNPRIPRAARYEMPAADPGPGVAGFVVGLVSDTHSMFDPLLREALAGADLILHAGDIGRPGVLGALAASAPVLAVPGNIDVPPLADHLREPVVARIAGLRFVLVHRAGKPGKLDADVSETVSALRPDVLVFGHSHVPGAGVFDGMLQVNPGSAGPRRFSLPRCAALLTITPGAVALRWLDLASPAARSRSGRRSSRPARSRRS